MTEPPSRIHRIGQPLDHAQAASRAAQAAALGDPTNLRVLSALAAGVSVDELATDLHLESECVHQAVAALAAVDVIHDDQGTWTLTAAAWVRFGRLLVGREQFRGRDSARHVVALPVAVESVARDLAYRFASTFSAETVSRYVAESYLLLDQRARVRTHLPTLTARYAAERLDALASASG